VGDGLLPCAGDHIRGRRRINVVLPSIRDGVGFSIQNLQWVLSGYLRSFSVVRDPDT
jgi:hypothetical protein